MRKFCREWECLDNWFSHQHISQSAVRTSPKKQLDPRGPIASWGGPVPVNGSVVVDLLFIVTPIVRVCNCSMFCCTLLNVPSSFVIILMGQRESWLFCYVCLPVFSWLLRGSSSRYRGFVCSLWLCYFLIILAYYFCKETYSHSWFSRGSGPHVTPSGSAREQALFVTFLYH